MTRRALGTGPTTTAAAGTAGERLLPVERLAVALDDGAAVDDGQQPREASPRPVRRPLGPRGGEDG